MSGAETLTFWYWWILSVVLIVVEIVAPGTAYFLWMGIAAGITGLVAWLLPSLAWQWQALMFAVCSVATIAAWRAWSKRNPPARSDEPLLNRRGEQYVGRTFTLTEPIVNGFGKLYVDDTTWKIEGEDIAVGTQIKIVGVDGTVLKVAKVAAKGLG